jgi:integrase
MPSVRPPPHAARLWRDLYCPELTIVTQLAANVFHRLKLPAFGAGALRPVPKTVAAPTRDSSVKKVERADAASTQGALYPYPLTHGATARPNQRHDYDATCDKLYPVGLVYELLMLTGLRLNEVADANWSEIDAAGKLWIIPKERMKGKNGKARAHAVPLTEDMLAVLSKLPRFDRGDFLFSTTFGASPVWMSSKVKARVDARMLRTLRALARRRGDDPAKVTLAPWTNHDIRRSVRSQLSRLKVTEEAREAVLGHVRPGIKRVYDLHDYLLEKREALEAWGARLRTILEPLPAKVVTPRMRC